MKLIVAEVAVEIAARVVRAALRDDVEVAAERASELRLSARRHDLELVHRVDAVGNPAQRRRIVVGGQAVDDEVVREVALAAHRQRHAGTAEVSAKSCVLATLVGDTPGTSSARSRKLRPFIGRLRTSVCETVPAIWLRAASSTVRLPLTVTVVSTPLDRSDDRQLERGTRRSASPGVGIGEPPGARLISYGPTLRYGNRKRPSASVCVSAVTFVSIWRARHLRAGHHASDGSVTRPLTLASPIDCCADAGAIEAAHQIASNTTACFIEWPGLDTTLRALRAHDCLQRKGKRRIRREAEEGLAERDEARAMRVRRGPP